MQIYSNKIFQNPVEVIEAFDNESFKKAFERLEILKNNYHILGYLRYEAKDIFLNKAIKSSLPLLYFEVFENYENYTFEENSLNVFLQITPNTTFEEYERALLKIKSEIEGGNTYEVNYTCDFSVNTTYSSDEIFQEFINQQKTSYCALIKNKYEEIISFSPELFFKKYGNRIFTKPMKGTIKRGITGEEDNRLKIFLANDIKNRAENIMIVDLLRNDLGKIAKTGSVKVPKLFDIETHKTLHQMTSEVTAELPENTTLYDIFEAIFPCGSITGAPKISTMEIIEKTEKGKREVYCGAIGYIHKNTCEFSVPIRILQKSVSDTNYKYRAGGAIVWNSSIKDEWEEMNLKTSFLTSNRQDWKLIETISVKNKVPEFFDEHCNRLKNSAKALSFKFNNKIYDLNFKKDGIYRIELSVNGEIKIEYRENKITKSDKIIVSNIKVSSKDMFLYHKTSYRPYYVEAMKRIAQDEIYDEIFFNERNELTEGARSNILIKKHGEYYTPPISCGILNGIYRDYFIKNFNCTEKILYLNDLQCADNIYCINSVRGMKEVFL